MPLFAQKANYLKKFESVLASDYSIDYSTSRIVSKSKTGNAIHFFELGYFINSNTILENFNYNDDVINNILSKAHKGIAEYEWIVTDVSKQSQNYSMKGKEFILYEGYLFRYIAEYLYKNPNSKVSDKDLVKKTFFKWYNKSLTENGDASLLYGIRLHMGSHWATVALYLTKLDPENISIYKKFIDEYNLQLKNNLKLIPVEKKHCYIWNSTYSNAFSNILKKRKKEVVVQDVSHGNHVVQYVIDSYNLEYGFWSKEDLNFFKNTLTSLIWKNKNKPADFVDGSFSKSNGMGWKQSDGWMKLMNVLKDKELYVIYNDYYKTNGTKIDKFYPNIQFYANMHTF